MAISSGQIIGLGVVGAIFLFALLFLWYVSPKVNAIFRPPLRTAVYWSLALLAMQAVFIIASGVSS